MEEAPEAAITGRESDVLGLLAWGLSNRLIARRLGISEKTVKNHLSSIYVKAGVAGRTQAALYARHTGLSGAGRAALRGLGQAAPPAVPALVPGEGVPAGRGALTVREHEVLRLLAWGLSNRLIARRLGISEKTVKNHLSSIYVKTGAADRTQAALYAEHTGLLAS
ncbi:LuxR C-terminal-related transcriptional regulator [Streptomyces sp. NPDC051987]|uniref:LuxR C-terminal-related transcriptional regulator n=1 Tax=Streptomyces sp. NPDC051987 TaxID=3155808 RepID=UPI00341DDC83